MKNMNNMMNMNMNNVNNVNNMKNMMNVKVNDIHWVCDDEEREDLPVNMIVRLNEEQFKNLQDNGPSCQGGLVDMIIDYYQDITGYHLDIYDLEYSMSVDGDEDKYVLISLGE